MRYQIYKVTKLRNGVRFREWTRSERSLGKAELYIDHLIYENTGYGEDEFVQYEIDEVCDDEI